MEHLPKSTFFDKQSQGDGDLFFQLHKMVIIDNFWKEVAHILADLFFLENHKYSLQID